MKKEQEYRGIKWTTYTDLSRKLCKSDRFVSSQMQLNKFNITCEQIIDKVLDGKSLSPSRENSPRKNVPVQEYRGIHWTTNIDLSRKLGKYDSFISYKKGEWPWATVEQIIDFVLDGKKPERPLNYWHCDKNTTTKTIMNISQNDGVNVIQKKNDIEHVAICKSCQHRVKRHRLRALINLRALIRKKKNK